MSKIKIPNYSLGEEIFNSISHGIGAGLSIAALVLMVVKGHTALQEVTVSLFGATMIILYTISCVYHALSKNLTGKKVLRVIDHCNVFLLVFGTYIPVVLLGVGGAFGWILFGLICAVTLLGITLTAINIDRFQVAGTLCHLISGWSILIAIPVLVQSMGWGGLLFLILGGVAYSLGALLYALGSKIKYMHCIFHIFCLAGTILHFFAIYLFLL